MDNPIPNAKPFTKGDPRINRKGRPKSFDALRKLVQDIGAEPAVIKQNEPIIINGKKVTNLEMMIRQAIKDPKLMRIILEYGWGKPKEEPAADEANALPVMAVLDASQIGRSFVDMYRDIMGHGHTEYVLADGRGSGKSSFASLADVVLLVNNPTWHVLCIRANANTLRNSVYAQIQWAISQLNLDDKFKFTTSPLEITYLPTGQKIFFRGANDPMSIKSIKPSFGAIAILHFEEYDQLSGTETVRSIMQSAIRGTDVAYIFKVFNTPRSVNHWSNKEMAIPKESRYLHRSSYLEMPSEWLGKVFLDEALYLKDVNPGAYDNEYMGVANGTGGMVFENVQIRKIPDEEYKQFDRILMGVDWGYYPDPFAWVKCHYDASRHVLYLLDEYKALKAGNRDTYNALVETKGITREDLIIADSAEPKSVADYIEYGANCRGAEKGPESVKYSMKWLQSLSAIVIDPERCPNAAEEFLSYELEQDKNGDFISAYPDKNNHFIDAVRYATNLIWRRRGK